MQFQILADAIEDNNGIIDRVSNDCEQRRNKGRVNLTLGKREYSKHDDDIVDEREHCRYAESPLKAIGDVENDECPRDDKREYRIRNQLPANRRADLLLAQHGVGSDILRERCHDLLALTLLEVDRADHDVLGGLDARLRARKLNCTAVQSVLCKARTHIGERNRLLKAQVDDRPAREVDAEVEATYPHADQPGDDEHEGNEKPDFPMSRNIELRHSSHPPSSSHRA